VVNESTGDKSKKVGSLQNKDSPLVLSDEKEHVGTESVEDHSNGLNDENI